MRVDSPRPSGASAGESVEWNVAQIGPTLPLVVVSANLTRTARAPGGKPSRVPSIHVKPFLTTSPTPSCVIPISDRSETGITH